MSEFKPWTTSVDVRPVDTRVTFTRGFGETCETITATFTPDGQFVRARVPGHRMVTTLEAVSALLMA